MLSQDSSDTGRCIRRAISRLRSRKSVAARRQIAGDLFRELLALPESGPTWLAIGADEILSLVCFYGNDLSDADFRGILQKVFPDLQQPWQFAYWRALYSLRSEYGDANWDLVCEDYCSDDDLVHANASAVVVDALVQGDPYTVQKIDELLRSRPEDDPVRDRIDRDRARRSR